MREQPVLVDSSVWIRSIRRGGPPKLKAAVRAAVEAGLVATCAAVTMELLVGARDEPEFAELGYSMRGLTQVPISRRVWDDASLLGYTLRKQGFQVGLPDLLIAQCAIASQRVLWHTDAHFEQIRSCAPLQTRMWDPSG